MDARCTDENLEMLLCDGRKISAAHFWLPHRVSTTLAERAIWEASCVSHRIHWPNIDEDLSVAGPLREDRVPN